MAGCHEFWQHLRRAIILEQQGEGLGAMGGRVGWVGY